MSNLRNKTLALAGVFQCAYLVNQIATKGITDQHDLETVVRATLNLNPKTTDEIFGSVNNLRTGLHALIDQLGDQKTQKDMNIARYVISLLYLQKKLAKRSAMLETISVGIERAKQQSEMFTITHDNVMANLAGIYGDTISLIPPKIMVAGENSYLSSRTNADHIRAILLGGIRFAVLWVQLGGGRWQILFKRRAFVNEARRLLDEEINPQLH
jgi:high frequency lysogenization protein